MSVSHTRESVPGPPSATRERAVTMQCRREGTRHHHNQPPGKLTITTFLLGRAANKKKQQKRGISSIGLIEHVFFLCRPDNWIGPEEKKKKAEEEEQTLSHSLSLCVSLSVGAPIGVERMTRVKKQAFDHPASPTGYYIVLRKLVKLYRQINKKRRHHCRFYIAAPAAEHSLLPPPPAPPPAICPSKMKKLILQVSEATVCRTLA